MTFEQRKQERQALIDHLLAQEWDVFGTLKFVNGRTIGRETANTLLRSYWNRIDRMFFGKAAERQNKTELLIILKHFLVVSMEPVNTIINYIRLRVEYKV